MITADGWFDWMLRMPGPPDKVWPDVNTLQGVLFHSAVGSFQGVHNVVFGPASNERSVTGVVSKSGIAVQYYSIFKSPWANGNRTVNRRFLGFEHEGGPPSNASEPLTKQQIDFDVRVLQDLAAFKQVALDYWRRPTSIIDMVASLYEHNEMTRFGALPTACPSGRIPWAVILRRLQEGGDYMSNLNRWNWEANPGYWRGRELTSAGEELGARGDFSLPAEARWVLLDVWIDEGELDVCDGDGKIAGTVGGGAAMRASILVKLSASGKCWLKPWLGRRAKVAQIGSLGYTT